MSRLKTDPNIVFRLQRFAVAADLELVADVGGPESGLPVILLHGGGQTRHSWKNLAHALTRGGCRVTNVDLRGHGDSGWSAGGDYSLDAMVNDLRILVANQPSPPVLVGASLGGIAALLATGESEQPVAHGIVLVDIVPKFERKGSDAIMRFMEANPDGFASLEDAVAAVARYLPHRPRPPSGAGLMKNLRQRKDGRLYWHWDPRLLSVKGQDEGARDITARMETAARRVRVPALLVRGAKSDLVSLEGVRHFLDLIPGADFADVKDASHMVAGDMNDVFNRKIIDFIEKRIRS